MATARNRPKPEDDSRSNIDTRGTLERIADETLTPGFAGVSAVPAIIGAKTAIPYLSRGAALLGAPKLAAAAGGYALGNAADNYFGISDKIGNTLGPMLAQIQNGRGTQRTGAFTPEELAAERARQSAGTGTTQLPILGSTSPTSQTAPTAPTAPTGPAGAAVEYDTLGATQDLNKSEEMQTLREENARREAQGLPDLSAPESVQFLNAVNPETFNPLNAEIGKQDQQIVNNFIAQQQAQQAQAGQGAQAPNLQQALAPTGNLPSGGGAAPQGGLIGSYQAPDGQNIGMFEGQPNAPINQAQLDSLSGQMVESGAPFISGGMTDESGQTIAGPAGRPEGMSPFIDQSGKVAYADPETANRMNALAGQEAQENRAAQQRFLASDAAKEMSNRQLNAVINSTYSQESKAREGRLAARDKQPGESQADRDTRIAQSKTTGSTGSSGSSSADGLTDNQRSKIYGAGTKEFEMSKAGINPQTGRRFADEQQELERQNAYDDARIASLERTDPTKLQEAKNQALALMDTMDFGGDENARNSTYRQILMQLLTNIDTFDASAILDPIA